jgi:hypothetical protein
MGPQKSVFCNACMEFKVETSSILRIRQEAVTWKSRFRKSMLLEHFSNSSVLWVITWRKVVWNRRFGTIYRSHLQGSRCPRRMTSWPWKMTLTCSPETSVSKHLTPHNNAKNGRIDFNSGGSLRSLIIFFLLYFGVASHSVTSAEYFSFARNTFHILHKDKSVNAL